jgi:phospholipid:diacylglycerol acyltransferase
VVGSLIEPYSLNFLIFYLILVMFRLESATSPSTNGAIPKIFRNWFKLFLGFLLGISLTMLFYKNEIFNSNSKDLNDQNRIELNIKSSQKVHLVKGLVGNRKSPGLDASKKGMKAKHPIIIVPGFTSSSLEVWKGKSCAINGQGRRKIWGSSEMAKFLLYDSNCWVEHMTLDKGTDPIGIGLRATGGLQAADYLFPGYWVWGKLLDSFAAIGYNPNNIKMLSYDWRLSVSKAEERDGFLSEMKQTIETRLLIDKQKVVILSHSMGSSHVLYFLKWVEQIEPNWVDKHVHAFTNIAGPLLGLPKAMSSLLSGESKDTAFLGTTEASLFEKVLSRTTRISLFRSWDSLANMLPKGGEFIWTEMSHKLEGNYQPMINVGDLALSVSRSFDYLNSKFSNITGDIRIDKGVHEMNRPQEDPKYWINPLATTLPKASNMKIFCLYGVGKPTERAYYYDHFDSNDKLDIEHNNFLKNIKNGVQSADGDGSVPLLSLGYMCVRGWKDKRVNPGEIEVVAREYAHKPASLLSSLRGGSTTGDHVDILGNYEMTMDILNIVSGTSDPEERIISSLKKL